MEVIDDRSGKLIVFVKMTKTGIRVSSDFDLNVRKEQGDVFIDVQRRKQRNARA